jgi:hypothetical protein
MKRNMKQNTRKLQLKRETVRTLSAADLTKANGGVKGFAAVIDEEMDETTGCTLVGTMGCPSIGCLK